MDKIDLVKAKIRAAETAIFATAIQAYWADVHHVVSREDALLAAASLQDCLDAIRFGRRYPERP